MNGSLVLLVLLLVAPVVALFAFAGCASFAAAETPPVTRAGPPLVVEPVTPPVQPPIPAVPKYKDVIAKAFPSHYWRLDDAPPSTTAVDIGSMPPLNGTYTGTVNRQQPGALRLGNDPNDLSTQFDGASGYVEVDGDRGVNPPASFSVEAWIRPDIDRQQSFVAVGFYQVSKSRGYVLEVLRTNGGVLKARARLGESTKFTQIELDLPQDPTVNGGWSLVAMVYRHQDRQLQLFVNNGITPATVAVPNYTPADLTTEQPPLRIGAGRVETTPLPAGAPAARFFRGRIDEVALYHTALVGQTVKDHFDAAFAK